MINTTVSRYTILCSICSADITTGDRMFCSALETSSKTSLAWGLKDVTIRLSLHHLHVDIGKDLVDVLQRI